MSESTRSESLEVLVQAAGDLLESGDPSGALPLYAQAVALATAEGHHLELSGLLGDMAVAQRRTGDLPGAVATNRRAIEVARSCRNHLDIARWSGNLGGLLYNMGEVDAAVASFREAMQAAIQTALPEQLAIAAGHLAGIMAERGRFSEAADIVSRAREHARGAPEFEVAIREQELDILMARIRSLRDERRLGEAREAIHRALAIHEERGPAPQQALLLLLLGDIQETEGDFEAASDAVEKAARIYESLGELDEAKRLRGAMGG